MHRQKQKTLPACRQQVDKKQNNNYGRILVDFYILLLAIIFYPFVFVIRMKESLFPKKTRHFKSVLITGASAGMVIIKKQTKN